MLFNSIEFLFFLPVVFLLYWIVFSKKVKVQNSLIVISSYFFYAWWDWRFLALIISSSICDYTLGRLIEKSIHPKQRRLYLWLSIGINIGILAFFKYVNFFSESFENLLALFGMQADFITLNLIIPIGISFYTFQTLSYVIDVYKKDITACKDIIAFFAFVSFFPQLVAGPIERAKNFLPQFIEKRNFEEFAAVNGLRQILWGFFKKIVVADNCGFYVNQIFQDPLSYSSPLLLLGAVLFAFQIYGDFSGYSDIAIGTARLFGFSLMRNFAYPYFSRDVAEFWRRWHISLTSWFKDYIYIPLGGSQRSSKRTILNVFIIFIISGFWHGANWTYIFWGTLNAFYFLPLLLKRSNRKHLEVIAKDANLPKLGELLSMLGTFLLICLSWIFFRAETLSEAFTYVINMVNPSNFLSKSSLQINRSALGRVGGFIAFMIIVEWIQRKQEHGLEVMPSSRIIRYGMYFAISLVVLYYFGDNSEFIYFQF